MGAPARVRDGRADREARTAAKLHDHVFVPERMIVAVYGDFKAAEMKALLTAKLGDWKKSGTPTPVLPPTPASGRSRSCSSRPRRT